MASCAAIARVDFTKIADAVADFTESESAATAILGNDAGFTSNTLVAVVRDYAVNAAVTVEVHIAD